MYRHLNRMAKKGFYLQVNITYLIRHSSYPPHTLKMACLPLLASRSLLWTFSYKPRGTLPRWASYVPPRRSAPYFWAEYAGSPNTFRGVS